MDFIKTDKNRLKNTFAMPITFLSNKILNMISKDLEFIPKNAYISNAAGDYVFIYVVKGKEVYVLTDSYYLDAELEDKEIDIYKSISTSNIDKQFIEEAIEEMTEYDYWDGDESDNFLQ
jgi:hypothetical protein